MLLLLAIRVSRFVKEYDNLGMSIVSVENVVLTNKANSADSLDINVNSLLMLPGIAIQTVDKVIANKQISLANQNCKFPLECKNQIEMDLSAFENTKKKVCDA